MVKITVDNRQLDVMEDSSILAACLANDIYIPNLCWLAHGSHPDASCRLCFVETENQVGPVTACTTPVYSGMRVITDSDAVRQLQRSALRLLLSAHDIDCRTCPANRQCELQDIARFLGMALKAKPLETSLKDLAVDTSHASLDYYPNRCVLCARCIKICHNRNSEAVLAFAKRGIHTVISSYGMENSSDTCVDCEACVRVCPVAALTLKL